MTDSHTPYVSQKKCETIVESYLEQGLAPCQIYKNRILTKAQTYKAMKGLKKKGWKMVSPGVWRFTDIHHVGLQHTPHIHTNSVRAHGIAATLRIKNVKNWYKREALMMRAGIEFRMIPQGQQIIVDGVKVWLTRHSIVFYLPYSWYDESAKKAAQKAMMYLIGLVQALEKKLKVSSFKINGYYHLKFIRQHYALVKNELARQYNRDKKKLFVYTEKGLWLLIDNSLNQNELENLHPITAQDDNEKVQESFNAVKEGFTNRYLAERIYDVVENQAHHEKNIKTHISAIQEMAIGVKALTTEIKRIRGVLDAIQLKGSGSKRKRTEKSH